MPIKVAVQGAAAFAPGFGADGGISCNVGRKCRTFIANSTDMTKKIVRFCPIEVAKDRLDGWIYFLKTAEIKDEFTAKGLKSASQKLDILKLDPADRKGYDRYMEAQRSDVSFVEEITSAVNDALKTRAEEALKRDSQSGNAIVPGQIQLGAGWWAGR